MLIQSIPAYWIAFGPHGPRALPPPGEGRLIFIYTMIAVGISGVFFLLIRSQARPAPGTMNQQYQEMTNEYLRVSLPVYPCHTTCTYQSLQNQKTEPISGVSSEGYTGKGQVQSKPKKPQTCLSNKLAAIPVLYFQQLAKVFSPLTSRPAIAYVSLTYWLSPMNQPAIHSGLQYCGEKRENCGKWNRGFGYLI